MEMKKKRRQNFFEAPFTFDKALNFDSEHKLRSENLMFDIDVWYPRLQKYTFRTTFIPLSRAEARSIVKCYRRRFVDHTGKFITSADVTVLRNLEKRLDAIIEKQFRYSL